MKTNEIRELLKKNWFPIALVLVVIFGYSVGKDRAVRDNAQDEIEGIAHVD